MAIAVYTLWLARSFAFARYDVYRALVCCAYYLNCVHSTLHIHSLSKNQGIVGKRATRNKILVCNVHAMRSTEGKGVHT